MKNNSKKFQSENKISVFIGALGVILAALLLIIVTCLTKGGKVRKATDVDSLAWYLARGNYIEITTQIRNDRRLEKKVSQKGEYAKFEAIADYALNSFYYHAYENVDKERSDFYLNTMNDSVVKMGEYSFAKGEIDSKINAFISKQNAVN